MEDQKHEIALNVSDEMSATIGKIASALSKAQGEITPADKSKPNYFKAKYADLNDVWSSIRGPLSKNELSVIQLMVNSDFGKITMKTILAHSSGEWISSVLTIPVKEATAIAYGSAISYARRYSLSAIVGATAGIEDDDGNEASKPAEKQYTKPAPQVKTITTAKPAQEKKGPMSREDFDNFKFKSGKFAGKLAWEISTLEAESYRDELLKFYEQRPITQAANDTLDALDFKLGKIEEDVK